MAKGVELKVGTSCKWVLAQVVEHVKPLHDVPGSIPVRDDVILKKKIEIKVSVDCCDGCKRKVKKVLRNIDGIQRAELDPLQPKVTIIGNVEPQSIVKKLLKVGKQAEILSNETQTTEIATDAEMPFIATEHISTKSKYLHEQETTLVHLS